MTCTGNGCVCCACACGMCARGTSLTSTAASRFASALISAIDASVSDCIMSTWRPHGPTPRETVGRRVAGGAIATCMCGQRARGVTAATSACGEQRTARVRGGAARLGARRAPGVTCLLEDARDLEGIVLGHLELLLQLDRGDRLLVVLLEAHLWHGAATQRGRRLITAGGAVCSHRGAAHAARCCGEEGALAGCVDFGLPGAAAG
eukprot:726599-Prymnesium_polylepis.1